MEKEKESKEARRLHVDKYPSVCNLCGGEVEYVSNEEIYGEQRRSGFVYRCKKCGAYVGTHAPRPKEALGLLSDRYTRAARVICHKAMDPLWVSAEKKHEARTRVYTELASRLNIDVRDCHLGYFDIDLLRRAYAEVVKMRVMAGLPKREHDIADIKKYRKFWQYSSAC